MKIENRIRYGCNVAEIINIAGMYTIRTNQIMSTQFFRSRKEAEDEVYEEARKYIYGK